MLQTQQTHCQQSKPILASQWWGQAEVGFGGTVNAFSKMASLGSHLYGECSSVGQQSQLSREVAGKPQGKLRITHPRTGQHSHATTPL
jgi:hypothetical protein